MGLISSRSRKIFLRRILVSKMRLSGTMNRLRLVIRRVLKTSCLRPRHRLLRRKLSGTMDLCLPRNIWPTIKESQRRCRLETNILLRYPKTSPTMSMSKMKNQPRRQFMSKISCRKPSKRQKTSTGRPQAKSQQPKGLQKTRQKLAVRPKKPESATTTSVKD